MPEKPRHSNAPNGDWKYQKALVLAGLDRVEKNDLQIFKRLNSIDIKLAKLSVKSGIWGLIGACIPVGIGLAIVIFRSQF